MGGSSKVYAVSADGAKFAFFGAAIGVPLATVLSGINYVLEVSKGEFKEIPFLIVVTLLLVSIRYFFRAHSTFLRCLRNVLINKSPNWQKKGVVLTHGLLVLFSCVNVSFLLVFGPGVAALVFSVQSCLLILQWLFCFTSIFNRPRRVPKDPVWRQYVAAHVATLVLDIVTLLIAAAFIGALVFVEGAPDIQAFATALAFVFLFGIVEATLHSKSL